MNEQQLRQQLMGRRIAARRTRRGLSQRALAPAVGVTQGAITAWERGENVPRWDELRKLADELDVPAAWIIAPLVESWSTISQGGEDEHDLGS